MDHRFTIDGNSKLESALGAFQEEVRQNIFLIIPEGMIESILLGGGYGRGEGGVFQPGEEQLPYNDFEYYIFVKKNVLLAQRKYHSKLAEMGHRLGDRWNMHVDFKIASIARLANQEVSMFSYDLLESHLCLYGKETPFTGCDHHHRAEHIPLGEATRLMFNRCSGLLFSELKLSQEQHSEKDIDFITRNQAKACLALGDTLLCALGKYHWSCRERHERFLTLNHDGSLNDFNQIKEWHQEGVAFKLRPQKNIYSLESLREKQLTLTTISGRVWLWLENKRLQSGCKDLNEYTDLKINKFSSLSLFKNLLLNLKTFGLGAQRRLRYPRERLYHALVKLLWEPKDPINLQKAATELGLKTNELSELTKRYESLWEKFG